MTASCRIWTHKLGHQTVGAGGGVVENPPNTLGYEKTYFQAFLVEILESNQKISLVLNLHKMLKTQK